MFASEARVGSDLCGREGYCRVNISEPGHSSPCSSPRWAHRRSDNTTVMSLRHDRSAAFRCPNPAAPDVTSCRGHHIFHRTEAVTVYLGQIPDFKRPISDFGFRAFGFTCWIWVSEAIWSPWEFNRETGCRWSLPGVGMSEGDPHWQSAQARSLPFLGSFFLRLEVQWPYARLFLRGPPVLKIVLGTVRESGN